MQLESKMRNMLKKQKSRIEKELIKKNFENQSNDVEDYSTFDDLQKHIGSLKEKPKPQKNAKKQKIILVEEPPEPDFNAEHVETDQLNLNDNIVA